VCRCVVSEKVDCREYGTKVKQTSIKIHVAVVIAFGTKSPSIEIEKIRTALNASAISNYSDPVHISHRVQVCLIKAEVFSTPAEQEA
jgi:hypothetical protein